MPIGFAGVTENPGDLITSEALEMMMSRYALALDYSQHKDVLELACGPGVGLGYLAQQARRVIGGDINGDMLRSAQQHYAGRIGLVHLDAQALPFADNSFDVAIMYEAIYYLQNPSNFMIECRRILRESGILIVCTVNKIWSDFNPSPLSASYYSAPELHALFVQHGFDPDLFGSFPATTDTIAGKVVSLIKRTAVSLHLVPGSMKSKQWLKRVFYGRLAPVPTDLSLESPQALLGHSDVLGTLVPIPLGQSTDSFKILYSVGHLR